DQGKIVLVPPRQHALPAQQPRDETSLAAILCLVFKLTPGEGRVLAKLMMNDHCMKDELRTGAGHDDQTITLDTLAVNIFTLRAKLKLHGIKITTLYRFGYGLDKKARDRIYKLLTEHDEAVASAQPQTKPEPSNSNLRRNMGNKNNRSSAGSTGSMYGVAGSE